MVLMLPLSPVRLPVRQHLRHFRVNLEKSKLGHFFKLNFACWKLKEANLRYPKLMRDEGVRLFEKIHISKTTKVASFERV